MKTVIVSCQMIKDELQQAMQETDCSYEVIWLEQGLHIHPRELQNGLQETLDGLTDVDRVLMALGDCGGGTRNLRTGDFELIYPRMDDCITLLLGSPERRRKMSSLGCYYISDGWLDGSRTLMAEYDDAVEKYGEELAQIIMESMFHNYKYLGLLKTPRTDLDALKARTGKICELFRLEQLPVDVTLDWLKQLLTGPWPEDRFVTVAPRQTTDASCVI